MTVFDLGQKAQAAEGGDVAGVDGNGGVQQPLRTLHEIRYCFGREW